MKIPIVFRTLRKSSESLESAKSGLSLKGSKTSWKYSKTHQINKGLRQENQIFLINCAFFLESGPLSNDPMMHFH